MYKRQPTQTPTQAPEPSPNPTTTPIPTPTLSLIHIYHLYELASDRYASPEEPFEQPDPYEGFMDLDSGVTDSVDTVSYTHLDVYKRQHMNYSPDFLAAMQ